MKIIILILNLFVIFIFWNEIHSKTLVLILKSGHMSNHEKLLMINTDTLNLLIIILNNSE